MSLMESELNRFKKTIVTLMVTSISSLSLAFQTEVYTGIGNNHEPCEIILTRNDQGQPEDIAGTVIGNTKMSALGGYLSGSREMTSGELMSILSPIQQDPAQSWKISEGKSGIVFSSSFSTLSLRAELHKNKDGIITKASYFGKIRLMSKWNGTCENLVRTL